MNWLFGYKYRVWVINTTSQAFLYTWEKWNVLLPSVDSLVKMTNRDAYIRTFQSFEFENKWLGFGRMKWNEENNRKWTTKYRNEEYAAKKLTFYGTEIWAPDWNQCSDKGIFPDLFIHLYHHPTVEKIREGLVIAIPKKIAQKNQSQIETTIQNFIRQIPDSTLSVVERSWTPGGKFPNRIEDMNPQELEKIVYQQEVVKK
jgi:hypothetical protein